MKTKKTENANLERRKPTLLLIGLICSMALVLESFEWLGSDYVDGGLESRLSAEIPAENILEMNLIVPKVKKVVQQTQTKSDEVQVIKKDEVISVVPKITIRKNDMPDIVWNAYDSIDIGGSVKVEDIDSLFIIVEDAPEFPGGLQALYAFLGDNIKYPDISADARSQGQAYVNFTIEKDGSITNVKTVAGSADRYCKKEAERVVGIMPNWTPGKQRGKKVRVSFTLPVRFVMD